MDPVSIFLLLFLTFAVLNVFLEIWKCITLSIILTNEIVKVTDTLPPIPQGQYMHFGWWRPGGGFTKDLKYPIYIYVGISWV